MKAEISSEEIKDDLESKKSSKKEKKEFAITDLPGVGAATAEKLKEAGFDTLLSIAVASPGVIVEASGVGEAVARKIIQTARSKLDMGFESGDEILRKRESIMKLTTGSKAFDTLLGGGVESGALTECYGAYGAGKSALAHQLAVNVQLSKEKGGANGQAIWIDTESSLPYDEKILIEKDNSMQLVKIGELVEEALNDTENITRYGETLSTADNPVDIKAVSYDPEDYKIKTFSITGFIKHPKQKVYEVKLSSGRKVRVTKYHNFFVLNEGCELKEIATKDLNIGNKIAIAGSIPVKMGIKAIDLSELFKDRDDFFIRGGNKFRSFLISLSNELVSICKEEGRCESSPNNWISRKLLPIKVYNKLKSRMSDEAKRELKVGGWIRKSDIPILIPITHDLMRFLGLYVAEGSCLKNKSAIITCTSEYVEDYVKYFIGMFGLNVLRTKSDLKINSKPLAVFIERLNLGFSAETKKVPEFILNLEKDYINAFIEGYVVGDGTENILTGTTICETKSKELVDGLLYSMCAVNVPARHHITTRTYKCSEKNSIRPEKDGEAYDMQTINWQTVFVRDSRLEELPNEKMQFSKILLNAIKKDYKNIKEFSRLVGMNYSHLVHILKNGSISVRKSNLKKILGHLLESEDIRKIKKIVDSDIWFDSIESIDEVGEEVVYDIEVMPGDKEVQNFIGGYGGIILHNTFRPERIKQIAEKVGLDSNETLKNIKVARAFNSDHQMILVDKIEELIKEGAQIKLVIVDSLMSHFRADFAGRGQLADRQQKINRHIHALLKLAEMYNVAIYLTNQVMSKPDTFFGDPTEAIGGNIVAHGMTYRIYLRRGKKGSRVAKMVDAPHLGETECCFIITEGGLADLS